MKKLELARGTRPGAGIGLAWGCAASLQPLPPSLCRKRPGPPPKLGLDPFTPSRRHPCFPSCRHPTPHSLQFGEASAPPPPVASTPRNSFTAPPLQQTLPLLQPLLSRGRPRPPANKRIMLNTVSPSTVVSFPFHPLTPSFFLPCSCASAGPTLGPSTLFLLLFFPSWFLSALAALSSATLAWGNLSPRFLVPGCNPTQGR